MQASHLQDPELWHFALPGPGYNSLHHDVLDPDQNRQLTWGWICELRAVGIRDLLATDQTATQVFTNPRLEIA